MKTYKILWNRSDYGKLIIKAKSEKEAEEMFNNGEYNEDDLDIKDGGMEFITIEELTN